MARIIGTVSRFALATAVLTFASGCGNNYRPVVSAINPVGPAAQPAKYAIVISNPGPTVTGGSDSPGLLTFVDFSGDEVVVTVNVGVDPYYLILNGANGYTLNGDRTLSTFTLSTGLITSQIQQTTLLPSNNDANGNLVLPTSIFPQNTYTYVTQPGNNPGVAPATPPPGRNSIAEFVGTNPLALQQELPVDKSFSPIFIAGNVNSTRSFAITPNVDPTVPGQVATIENITPNATIDPSPLTVGRGPVYGVMTADGRRVFIMNQIDGTVSVINAQTNLLDIPPTGSSNPIKVGTAPLWADFAPTLNQLVVANAGDGVSPGSVSIISIPLCSPTTQPTNPTCDANNPVDATGFGTVLANVPTGLNTVMVSVLQDGTRAYVANTGDPTLPCGLPPAVPGSTTVCSVSVVNLTTRKVTRTIYSLPDGQCQAATSYLCGHPAYIAATTGSPTGKVYVVSKDSTNLSVIRTDTDTVDATIPLQGKGVAVRLSAQ
jgi:DNA-binding beta-propeller fold protein YncE